MDANVLAVETVKFNISLSICMNWKHALSRLKFWKAVDDSMQDAMNSFIEKIAPSSYSPVLDDTSTCGYLDGLCSENTDLKDWLTYWLYEVPCMDGKVEVKDGDGRKYNFKKEKDVIKFLDNNYPEL